MERITQDTSGTPADQSRSVCKDELEDYVYFSAQYIVTNIIVKTVTYNFNIYIYNC
jgi:hypothetical protein